MSEPEQCIICLEPLPHPKTSTTLNGSHETLPTSSSIIDTPVKIEEAVEQSQDSNYQNIIAVLDGCEHIIHDQCIRSWAEKTNSCPICRKVFHSVNVFNGVDGTAISTYLVQDKKQVAEFDFQQWLGENVEPPEEEDVRPCPVCGTSEREDLLLLCDGCDAAYHTYCLGLNHVPEGDWFCIECQDLLGLPGQSDSQTENGSRQLAPHVSRPQARGGRGSHVRTRARLRRAQRQVRHAEFQGPWEEFAGRFFELSDVDLDNADDEFAELEQFRRMQQLERQELRRWQQRMNIANRLGAREAFAHNIPPQISEHLRPPPPPVQETRDERRAWGALERAREAEAGTSTGRKRKARSITASPSEPAQEPERKLKRPRTRRLPTTTEASSSAASPAQAGPSSARNAQAQNTTLNRGREPHQPQLVSSLLKELEPNATSEDETAAVAREWRILPEASSPAMSPSPSAHSSPRALSMTPPPLPSLSGRPASPTLSLSTHIQPVYLPANYSPTRNGSDASSDSETRTTRAEGRSPELRQPRPRRPRPTGDGRAESRVEDVSSNRTFMTPEEKKNINDIVKSALRPHWHAQKLTADQYAVINRDISRKLYEEVRDAASLDDETRRSWEKRATKEVALAVEGLQA